VHRGQPDCMAIFRNPALPPAVLTAHFLLWNVVCFYDFTDIEFVLNVLFL
jgi:hypothetical protein